MKFPFLGKGEFQNPRAAAQAPQGDIYDINRGVVPPPAGAPAAPAPAAAPEAPAVNPLDQAAYAVSWPDTTFNGHRIVILTEMNEGEQPVPFEKIWDAMKATAALPNSMRPDPLAYPHFAYYYDVVDGKVTILTNEYPPDTINTAVIEEYDNKVADIMAKLTGKRPKSSDGPVTADALKAASFDDLYQIFYDMDQNERQRIANAIHKAIKKRKQEAEATGGDEGSGRQPAEQPPRRQQQPQPQRQQQPARKAPPMGGSGRNRAAW